ncbi:hypothetical protein ACH4TY_11100 [Streptomyces anulatus]
MSTLSVHMNSLRSTDRKRALRSLSALAQAASPQSVAFESEAVTYIPALLELALERETVAQAEVLNYLGNVYGSALGAWRRIQADCAPDEQPDYDEMVAWEDSIARSYADVAPAAMETLTESSDARVRGAALQLASQLELCRTSLIAMLPKMFAETTETALKVDIIEALAHTGITLKPDGGSAEPTRSWLHRRRESDTPEIRLGATLSLIPRVDPDLREALVESALSSSGAERAAALEAMWLYERTIEWATRRKVAPTRYIGA